MKPVMLLKGEVDQCFVPAPHPPTLQLMPHILNPAGTRYYFKAYVLALKEYDWSGSWRDGITNFNLRQGASISALLRKQTRDYLLNQSNLQPQGVAEFYDVLLSTVKNWIITNRLPMPSGGISPTKLWEICQFTGPDIP